VPLAHGDAVGRHLDVGPSARAALLARAALETGGVLVSEKIKLEFDVSAIKSA